jgi:hypothetical protein
MEKQAFFAHLQNVLEEASNRLVEEGRRDLAAHGIDAAAS